MVLLIAVPGKIKNVRKIFSRKRKCSSIKKERLCYFILFYWFHVFFFMSRKFSPALQVQKMKRLETIHFFILKANTPFLRLLSVLCKKKSTMQLQYMPLMNETGSFQSSFVFFS